MKLLLSFDSQPLALDNRTPALRTNRAQRGCWYVWATNDQMNI